MKDPRFCGLNLITYLDDVSRCRAVQGSYVRERSCGAQTGHQGVWDSCNHTVRQRIVLCRQGRSQEPTGTWTPTLFENDLLNLGIELINSRPYHSQTNGNLERFHRSMEEEIDHYESLSEYIKYYNKRRLYF